MSFDQISAASSLKSQANTLVQTVAVFRVGNSVGSPATHGSHLKLQ
jgi:hypothetical protein